MRILKSVVFLLGCAAIPTSVLAQDATPLFAKMEARDLGDKLSVDRKKLCALAVKTYDYGVKELGLDDADSKQAVRADKALPFTLIALKELTQTDLLFNRAVAEITPEFSVFKSSDAKAQKKLFKTAKGVNKACAKPYENSKLEGYGTLTNAADYITGVNSEDARGCMAVSVSGLGGTRASVGAGVIQYMTWRKVYHTSLRSEGYPSDQLIEKLNIIEVKDSVKEIEEQKALELYDMCPARYKKARFQAGLKKDELAEVPAVNWD